jgi:hypothetical protein
MTIATATDDEITTVAVVCLECGATGPKGKTSDRKSALLQTMSSREIAELTGKEHKNVLADIRKMLDELGKAAADFSAVAHVPGPNGSNRKVEVYNLPKRETLILVSGYSVAMRAKIIDRWQELEAVAAPVLNLRDPLPIAAAVTCQRAASCVVRGPSPRSSRMPAAFRSAACLRA